MKYWLLHPIELFLILSVFWLVGYDNLGTLIKGRPCIAKLHRGLLVGDSSHDLACLSSGRWQGREQPKVTSGVWHAWEHYSMSKGAKGEFRVFLLPPQISFPGLG